VRPLGEVVARLSITLADRRVRDGVALLGYAAVVVLWFHRLLFNYNDAVLYGPNDASYGIRQYWGAEYLHSTPFTQTRDPLNGAPEGLPIAPAIQIANALIPTTIWTLHYLVGFTGASNIFLLGGIVLTGFSFYVLLTRLGIHPLAAFYAGYALSLNPWMLERAAAGHSGFMQAWIFPLTIGAMLRVHRRRTVGSAVLAGLVLAFAFYDNSYYGLMAALVFGIFWILDFVVQRGRSERFWTFTMADISVLTAVAAFVPALVAWVHDKRAVSAGVSNGANQVQSLGATTQAYFLPSYRNPVLGHITKHFYPQAAYVWSENTLYLGWSLILIASVGAYLVIRRRTTLLRRASTRFFYVGITVLAPAAFLFSLQRKTTWFGVTIPMPSYVISEFTSFWRVYARFGELVTLALAALAALALTELIRRRDYGRWLAAVALGLLVFEYSNGVLPIYKLKELPYSAWIAKQPQGIVANYPMPTDNPAALRLVAETYFQQIYNKHPEFTMFGSGYGGTREDAIRDLVRYVTDPVTPGVLKAEGVKYVLLHDDTYRLAGETPPPVPAGMHLVARIPGDVRALELDSDVAPADISATLEQHAAEIAAVQGLNPPQVAVQGGATTAGGATVVHGSASVTLRTGQWALRRAELYVTATSSNGPQPLAVRDQTGNVVGRWTVGTQPTNVSFGPLATNTRYVFATAPGARLTIVKMSAQPLADFSTTVRSY